MTPFEQNRLQMVEKQVRSRGVRDPLVLDAMGKVHREAFVAEQWRGLAYADRPLPIGAGQTISQPFIVAYMIEALALKGEEKVLEIGAGSGYAAAVLAEIVREVYAVERIGALAEMATSNLSNEGYENVHILHSKDTRGWNEHAPFDAILVSAAAPKVPQALKDQLAIGGRMVIPIGSNWQAQELVRLTQRQKGKFDREYLAGVQFVPLIE